MKKITEMTHDEIVALTEKDLERLVDLECAETGVPLMDAPPEKPISPIWDDTNNAFAIECIIFDNRESAEIVQSCLRAQKRHIHRFHYGKCEESDLAIKEVFYIDNEEADRREPIKEAYSAKLAKYNDLRAEYDKLRNRRNALADPIYSIYRDSIAKESVCTLLTRESARYFELAEGNIQVALNFLTQAFPDALESTRDIFNPRAFMQRLTYEKSTKETLDANTTDSDV